MLEGKLAGHSPATADVIGAKKRSRNDLGDSSANGSPAGLGYLVSLEGVHHAIRGEEEHTVMVHALHHLLH